MILNLRELSSPKPRANPVKKGYVHPNSRAICAKMAENKPQLSTVAPNSSQERGQTGEL